MERNRREGRRRDDVVSEFPVNDELMNALEC